MRLSVKYNMKPIHLISLLICGMAVDSYAAAPLPEPATSAMATGHWVKIRIQQDAVYEMTYEDLKALGFENPRAVQVYGYAPNVLLTHDVSRMPVDLEPIYTLHSGSNNKLLFYGKGDTEFAPELWKKVTDARSYLHNKHAHSIGATYFLSDAGADAPGQATIVAPHDVDAANALAVHTSLVYHEDDAVNYSSGGFWFGGQPINSSRTSETHSFTVSKVADGTATMVYKSLLSNTKDSKFNYLLAEYSDGIKSSESTGSSPAAISSYQEFSQSIRFQPLFLPVNAAPATYDVTFSVHPEASPMASNCALDFYALLYNRENDVAGDSQMFMYFENFGGESIFGISGMEQGNWQVWNVNNPSAPARFESGIENGVFYGTLTKAATDTPNQVVAFNIDAQQPKPEILGEVENQNLHALATPDLVILTSRMFEPAAQKVADFHRRLQGLDVAVVDQQKVFNEFASGNTSPESVRRFLRHLDNSQPGKLKGLLLLGPGTYNNAAMVNDNQPYVITTQAEDYSMCPVITKNYCSDTFFGRFGDRQTFDTWISRGAQLQIIANDIDIAVGRLPFISLEEIDNYYSKAEKYITAPPVYPGIGNVVLASDYSTKSEEHHLTNAEALAEKLGDKAGTTVTVIRAASNLVSSETNNITCKMMNSALERGASFYGYFGHGNASSIAGRVSKRDFLFDMQSAQKQTSPGRYPLMYIGSCNVAPFDKTTQSLTNVFLANPSGGAIAVVASCREVFQPMNQKLGQDLINHYMNAADGEWLGSIWAKAQSEAISYKNLSKDNIANHLDYNLMGDPALPHYGETHSVSVEPIANNNLDMLGINTVSGSVLAADGSVDTGFNGYVTLTLYDVPNVAKNVLGAETGTNYTYYPTITLDQEVIAQVTGNVTGGRFSVDFVAPTSSRTGSHRIQAYAFSSDGTGRGLGYINDVSMTYDEAKVVSPEGNPVQIRAFAAVYDNNEAMQREQAVLSAEISAPAGIAPATNFVNPVRLTVDGISVTNPHRMLNTRDASTFGLDYVTKAMTGGKHSATLAVMDALGNWAEETIEYVVDNAPAATLSASVAEDGEVSFEVASSIVAEADKRLVVEKLNGDIVADECMDAASHTLSLAPGVYRAYVQMRSLSAAAATPKIMVTVN